MSKDNKPHTIISEEEIIFRDVDKNQLTLGYDESFEKSREYYKDDKYADIFYIEVIKQDENEDKEESVGFGIALTVDQLQNLINTAQKLIRKLDKEE